MAGFPLEFVISDDGGTYVVYTREPDYDCDEGLVRDTDTESVSVFVPSWRYNETLPWLVAVERCTSGTCNGRAVTHEGVSSDG
jgi:hypothetical protein